jgi:hypothetical protein
MENFDPIDVKFLINSDQVKQDAAEVRKDITGTADAVERATTKATQKITYDWEKATREVEEFRQETERTATTVGRTLPQAAAQARTQFNGLNNSINQMSRELPAFTFSAQTGFLAISNNLPILVDEINALRVANAAAAASGAATVPVWTAIRAALFSWMTVITLAITALTLFGPKLFEMAKNLFSTKKAIDETKEAQEALNKAFESSDVQEAIEQVIDLKSNLQLAKDGLIDKKTVVDQYNESIGKAAGEVKTLDEVEKGLVANADAYVKATLYKAAAEAAREKIAKEMMEAAQAQLEAEERFVKAQAELERQKGRGTVMSGTGATSNISNAEQAAKNAQFEVDQAKKSMDDLANSGNNLIKKLKEMSLATGLDLFTEPEDEPKGGGGGALNARQQLLDKIAALDAEYARKRFTKDEEEVQALRDKFAKVRELVDRFNADPKNQAKRIDLAGLDETEANATADLRFRQETAAMMRELGEQKKLFQEFEAYKAQFGEAAAREQYGAQIGEFESYLDMLRSKVDQNKDVYEAMSLGSATGPQSERFAVLQKALEAESKEVQSAFNKLLKDNQDLQSKLLLMEEQYQKKRAQLIAAGKTAEAEVLRQSYEKDVNSLLESHVKQLDAYKALFEGISRLSDANARKVIDNARRMLATTTGLTDAQRRQIEQKIIDLERGLEDRNLDRIDRAAQSFAMLSRELGGVNTALGGMMAIMAQVVASSVAIKDNITALKDGIKNYRDLQANGSGGGVQGALSTVGAIAGVAGPAGAIVSAVAQTVNAVVGYFKGLKRAKEEAQRAVEDFYRTAREGEMEYQRLVRERELESAARGKTSYQAIIAQLEVLKRQAPAIQEAYDRVFKALQGGEFAAGIDGRHGTWFRKAKTWDVLASLAGSDYERLEKLYLQGKLTDAAKRDFEALKELREELEAAGLEVEDLQRQLNEMLTGTSTGGLADGLTELFRNGKMAAADFGQSFEQVMRNAIVNSFRYRYLEEAMQPFYDQLAILMNEGSPTQEQIDALRKQYEAIGQQAADTWKALEEATGISLTNPNESGSQRGLTGAIRRELTEATGSELAGLFRGFFDVSKRGLILNESRAAIERQHYEAMLRSLAHQAAIETNTARTADKVTEAVTELKQIVKNTKQASGRDLGVGGP